VWILTTLVVGMAPGNISLLADTTPPPFMAEVRIDLAFFSPGDAQPLWPRQVFVTMAYSNGWWQIDTTHTTSMAQFMRQDADHDLPTQTVNESYMRVPDGVRFVSTPADRPFNDEGVDLHVASVCSLSFPSPASLPAFVSWLALCARPELPLEQGQIHRFLDAGPCPVDLFREPRTLADYALTYLNDGATFLAGISITNPGVSIDAFPSAIGGWDVRYRQLEPPLNQGFAEFVYWVKETVDYQGYQVPSRAVAKRIAASGKTIYDQVVCELNLLQLTALDAHASDALARPRRLLAQDFRIPDLPAPLTYYVTNEAWRPTSDPAIATDADFLRGAQAKSGRGRVFFLLALVGMVLLPLIAVAWRRLQQHRSDARKTQPTDRSNHD